MSVATKVVYDPNYNLLLRYRQTGNIKARDLLILNNKALLIKEASLFLRKSDLLLFDDLYQEAVIGFMNGLEKFDFQKAAARPIKVSSFCVIYIRKQLFAYINQIQTIRVPESTVFWAKRNGLSHLYRSYVVGIDTDDIIDEQGIKYDFKKLLSVLNPAERLVVLEYYGIEETCKKPAAQTVKPYLEKVRQWATQQDINVFIEL